LNLFTKRPVTTHLPRPNPPAAPRGLPPAGCARGNRRSAAAAVLESTKVTPILDSFRTRNNAEIRAVIENEACAFSVYNDDAEAVVADIDNSNGNSDDLFGVVDGHSYFGGHPKPNPEDQSDIEREFITLFCSLRKENYPKRTNPTLKGSLSRYFARCKKRITPRQRRSKSSIKPSATINKLKILGDSLPPGCPCEI
jgi:hypothetical protein